MPPIQIKCSVGQEMGFPEWSETGTVRDTAASELIAYFAATCAGSRCNSRVFPA